MRRRKTPGIVVRALKERLQDNECPDDRGNWWPVRLEALAMLGGGMFKETILEVMRDPLSYRKAWRWADSYWQDRIADSAAEGRSLYDGALQKIRAAGFEPARFGYETMLKSDILAQAPDWR